MGGLRHRGCISSPLIKSYYCGIDTVRFGDEWLREREAIGRVRPRFPAEVMQPPVCSTISIRPSFPILTPFTAWQRNSVKPGTSEVRASLAGEVFEIKEMCYRPPGTQHDILKGINLSLPEKSLGLIYGRSGSGKTTLLQILAGLSKPTSGSIFKKTISNCSGKPNEVPVELSFDKIGIVFQFPERYFLTDKVLEEILFGWPRHNNDPRSREQMAIRLQAAIHSVDLSGISLDQDPRSLSGGFKRRLALAVQLMRMPELLLLDEPLAGLDWRARADVVKLLKKLKRELTLLVVSHDLKELASVVDKSWKMEMGGILKEAPLPPG